NEPGAPSRHVRNRDSIQPANETELDDDEERSGEVQSSNLPSAQCSVKASFPGAAHGYTCSRGAARLKNRNAAATTANSIPNITASHFGLRVLSGSNGFRGSRKTFSARFTTPRSCR